MSTPGPRARPVTGADLLVSALEAAGTEVVFGLPGVHNLPLWRSLASSRIRLVTVRHEQTAAYAADGYARSTGRVGIALTTTGPGAANTLGALGEAWAARSPVVVIATDIPSTIRRPGTYRGALHEMTDQGAMFAPLVKQVFRVGSPGEAGPVLARALLEAARAPARPVYIEIPTDYLPAVLETVPASGGDLGEDRRTEPDGDEIAAAVDLIERASRPLLWAGGGAIASGAGPAIGSIAERLAAPVFTTYQARGLLGRDHPCAVGLPPHLPSAGALWDEADLVITIGSDLDGMMTQNWRMPAPPALLAINVDPVDASKNYRPDLVVTADAARAVGAITDRIPQRPGVEALREDLYKLRREARVGLAEMHPEAVGFLDSFESAVPADAVIVADMCIPGYWLAGFHPVSGPRRFAYPVGWGTLGFAFPAAIGAAVGAGLADSRYGGGPPVVSVSGDGGFLFACGDLATVAQELPRLTIVIVDDGGYGMLRYDQRKAGDEIFGVDLLTPDFAALAGSFGLEAQSVDGLGKEFGEALRDAIARPSPSVVVARAALEPPPTTSPRWYRAG